MKNTLENKAKFCALYWGQKVVKYNDIFEEATHVDFVDFIDMKDKAFLELKPLSSISDEDFTEVMCLLFPFQPRSSFKKGKFYIDHLNIKQADYLRSRGYALTWMGISVEELVNRGWIKLKGETK